MSKKETKMQDKQKRIKVVETKTLPLSSLEPNNGQIEGLPNNPRQIKGDKFEKLKRSIEDNPEMLGMRELLVYPYGEKYVIIGGNMRYEALKALGYGEAPCKIIESATAEQLRAYTIKDNSGFGEWDWDELANDWDDAELDAWGLDFPKIKEEAEAMIEQASSEEAISTYSDDTNYDLKNLTRSRLNDEITRKISEGVRNGEIREEIAQILDIRAKQCTVFNFDELTKFYRSNDATETERELLRRLYLVFVAPKELFETQILRLNSVAKRIYDDELITGGNEEEETERD